MPTYSYSPHRRRRSSFSRQDIPDFLEESPFFLPISTEAELRPPKPVARPTLRQLLRSKNLRTALGILVALFFFWKLVPKRGDRSYQALGRWGLIKGGGARCLYDEKRVVAISKFREVDWEKNGYVTYVTHHQVLCNAVMIFESLMKLGSKAKRVMMIPNTEEFALEGYGSRSAVKDATVKRLLRKAIEEYEVELIRVTVIRKEMSYQMWAESYTKLLAFNLTQFDRLIVLDSDATVLKPMDELFSLPPTPAAMPRAYWLETPTLASHIMLIQPSALEASRIKQATDKAGLGVYDMEIVNTLFGSTCVVLPTKPYALLTGEFRRPKDKHEAYLNPGEEWDPENIIREVKLVHFSDYPMPKPWEGMSEKIVMENKPKCTDKMGVEGVMEEDCGDLDVWRRIYRDFRNRRESVCGLGS